MYRCLLGIAVSRIPNAATLLHNNNFNNQLLRRGPPSTTPLRHRSTITYASPSYYTDAPNYYSASSYTTKTAEYYTTTYAALSYYTEAPQVLHRGSPSTTPRLQLLHRGSSYYTEAPATTPRLQLLSRPKRANTTPKRPVPLCTDRHSHN